MVTHINFSKDIILEDDRVLMSCLQKEDYLKLLPFALTEPKLWQYSLVSASGEKALENYLSSAYNSRKNETAFPFVVFDKKVNEVAGMTRLYNYDKHHNTISIGHTWYGQRFQGTGLNKHCKFLLLSQAFDQWKIERVEFRADYRNKRSINAMKSIGCTEEGILRSNCKSLEGRRDSIVLSILKEEWDSHIKNELIEKL